MSELLQKKSVAVPVALIVVVLTIMIAGGIGLNRERSSADEVFYSDPLNMELSISHELETRLENAYNMGIVAKRCKPDSPALTEMEHAYSALTAALKKDDRALMPQANRDLEEAVESLYDESGEWSIDETDSKLLLTQRRSFLSAGDKITHSSYNDSAREFNKKLTGFPGAFISSLMGVAPLPLFL